MSAGNDHVPLELFQWKDTHTEKPFEGFYWSERLREKVNLNNNKAVDFTIILIIIVSIFHPCLMVMWLPGAIIIKREGSGEFYSLLWSNQYSLSCSAFEFISSFVLCSSTTGGNTVGINEPGRMRIQKVRPYTGLPCGPMGKTPSLPLQGAEVTSLGGKVRPHMPWPKKIRPLQCVQFPRSGDVSGVRWGVPEWCTRRQGTELRMGTHEHLFMMLFVWQRVELLWKNTASRG